MNILESNITAGLHYPVNNEHTHCCIKHKVIMSEQNTFKTI